MLGEELDGPLVDNDRKLVESKVECPVMERATRGAPKSGLGFASVEDAPGREHAELADPCMG